MKDPKQIHLQTTEETILLGWGAESRDADGHLTSFYDTRDADCFGLVEWIKECTSEGETVTFFPQKPITDKGE
jgi:hypothetical protein